VPSLLPGTESAGAVTITVPTTTAAGTYYLLACTDDAKKVIESNENNNCRASATQVTVGP
jgi:subtilase family serine protease